MDLFRASEALEGLEVGNAVFILTTRVRARRRCKVRLLVGLKMYHRSRETGMLECTTESPLGLLFPGLYSRVFVQDTKHLYRALQCLQFARIDFAMRYRLVAAADQLAIANDVPLQDT